MILKGQETFGALYTEHAKGLKRFLTGMVGNESIAEELGQEAFLKAWKSLPTFSFQSSFKTWLYSVAINTAKDWLKRPRHLETQDVEVKQEVLDTHEVRAIHAALGKLEEESRIVLMLHYFEDMALKDIAKTAAIPVGTVKSRLHTAKGKLKAELKNQGFDL